MVTTKTEVGKPAWERNGRSVVFGGELCAGSSLEPWLLVATALVERYNAAKDAAEAETGPAARLELVCQAAGILDDIDTLRQTLVTLTGTRPFEFPGIKVARHGLARARRKCLAALRAEAA